MAGTAEVITTMERLSTVHYPVLVPNLKGLEDLFELLSSHESSSPLSSIPVPTDEIAIFSAASEAFSKANTNCSIAESLRRLELVAKAAQDKGLRVRGYVSVVMTCPYTGKADYTKVRDITKELLDMGCYEVSLGDTTGTGNPHTITEMLETVMSAVPAEKLGVSFSLRGSIFDRTAPLTRAFYLGPRTFVFSAQEILILISWFQKFHDTFGMGVANVMAALSLGVRTIDSSIGGLGGCPYSPGATGNVATEDVLYALKDSPYIASGDLDALVDIGNWISGKVGRPNSSRVGNAISARKLRELGKAESKL
jgi:hydroxymethylglutaryl-CoA lyase